ncbi:DUF4168 domain-containing protein [Marinobacter halodurans]|uniref:DUF4168 domain-containing protein n=1 Tax=Marinobacter halodurans TaxID=2528979 RepID=A0ABY1ZIH2_9GAMM|nr:DUF4168 domain-containing protein [Marinobacter halodurans]TBW54318.1 DUF4168 domain-containing protein [Marinobacter halodurans]
MKTLMTSVAVSMALLASGPALAADPQTQDQDYQNPAATGTQKTNYSDQELKKFIKVQKDISSIREEYIPQIKKEQDKDKARKLQIEANDKMVAAIQDKGLDIPTYNAIATAYNSEPKLRHRVEALM